MLIAVMILAPALGVQSGVPMPGLRGNPQIQPLNPGPQRNDQMRGDRRLLVLKLSGDLVRQAEHLSKTSFDYFKGWNGEINNKEQAVLFKTEEFAAACRLFNKLAQDETNYFRRESMRTNLYNASRYVAIGFRQLEDQIRQSGMQREFDGRRNLRPLQRQQQISSPEPVGMSECSRILDRIEDEFTRWR
jgi:hypothetical protein